ncbi:MFS transporter [uncultured Sphingomonas sp.]|uniref:MFS transporter n=1 Tax=uncultured Sphingomonas sp. TaxID=158754 RepID=UPI0035CB34BC
MSRTQVRAVAVVAALSALDGYDVLSMTFAAPGISKAWNVDKGVLGLALASGLVGMAVGSLLLAPFADRYGRRRIVVVNLLLMIGGMLMAAFAGSIVELSVMRVVTGIGIGGMVPIIVPLAAEFANSRRRRLALAVMSIGYPIGGLVGGLVAAWLLHSYDWRAVFLFGAGMGLLLLVAVLIWLPEPLAFLLTRRDPDSLERVNAYLLRCGQRPITILPQSTQPSTATPYRQIFSPAQRGSTLTIMTVNLLFITTVYYMLSWMPQIVADAGHTASFATLVATAASLGGILACIAVGAVGERLDLRATVATLMIGFSVFTIVFGVTPATPAALLVVGGLAGVFLYSGTLGLYALIVETFEPGMRTTGVGFVMGIGRAAGAVAPALAGHLFAIGTGRAGVSAIMAIGALIAGLLVMSMSVRHAQRLAPAA